MSTSSPVLRSGNLGCAGRTACHASIASPTSRSTGLVNAGVVLLVGHVEQTHPRLAVGVVAAWSASGSRRRGGGGSRRRAGRRTATAARRRGRARADTTARRSRLLFAVLGEVVLRRGSARPTSAWPRPRRRSRAGRGRSAPRSSAGSRARGADRTGARSTPTPAGRRRTSHRPDQRRLRPRREDLAVAGAHRVRVRRLGQLADLQLVDRGDPGGGELAIPALGLGAIGVLGVQPAAGLDQRVVGVPAGAAATASRSQTTGASTQATPVGRRSRRPGCDASHSSREGWVANGIRADHAHVHQRAGELLDAVAGARCSSPGSAAMRAARRARRGPRAAGCRRAASAHRARPACSGAAAPSPARARRGTPATAGAPVDRLGPEHAAGQQPQSSSRGTRGAGPADRRAGRRPRRPPGGSCARAARRSAATGRDPSPRTRARARARRASSSDRVEERPHHSGCDSITSSASSIGSISRAKRARRHRPATGIVLGQQRQRIPRSASSASRPRS